MHLSCTRFALLLALLASSAPSLAGQSEAERAQERPPGAWHGQWEVFRDFPGLHTRGAALALDLTIWHAEGDAEAQVQWSAGRGLCPEPLGEACEWVGSHGEVWAQVLEGRLLLALPVSADEGDPLFLQFGPRRGEAPARGSAINARGGIGLLLEAQPLP